MTIQSISDLVEEVAENIYKIKLPMPFPPYHINVYLLKENNRLAMVDCGLPMAWELLQDGFKTLNIPFSDLTDIFLTHYHADHTGALPQIREVAPEARIYIHRLDQEFLGEREIFQKEKRNVMQDWLVTNGAEDLATYEAMSFKLEPIPMGAKDRLVEGGEYLQLKDEGDGWEIIWTPGHTNGHFVLYNSQRKLLLSGDHLLTSISSNIGKYPGSREDPLGDFISSLDKLAGLNIDTVLPAHGKTFGEHTARINTLKHHHQLRLKKIMEGLEDGSHSAIQVTRMVWGDRLQGFDKYLGLMEVLSHLERLCIQKQIVAEERDNVVYYRVA
jgi:glyoxylase-like metal-dependent hydrolase (beta-lactamase superfamily II)